MGKEPDKEKLRKKKEKAKIKARKKRWKRINARIDRTMYLAALGICVTFCLLEVKEKKAAEAALGQE